MFSLLGFAAIAAAIMVALHRVYGAPPGDTVGVAIFAGFFAWMTANMVTVAVGAWRERSALLAGLAGAAPVDGRHTVLVGRIEAFGPPLFAPFTGTPCVAYSFEVFQIRGGARRSHKAVYYDGISVTPSVILTDAGSFRLLAVPDLDSSETSVSRDAALRRAADHLRTIPFEPAPPPFSRPAIERQWSDDDGAFRRETRHTIEDVDLSACTLTERQIEHGARVCVFGH
jgi:hypothetical protein